MTATRPDCQSLDRNRSWVINAAIESYLDLHRWQLEHIEQGIRDSEEGRTHSTEEIRARLMKYHAGAKQKA